MTLYGRPWRVGCARCLRQMPLTAEGGMPPGWIMVFSHVWHGDDENSPRVVPDPNLPRFKPICPDCRQPEDEPV